VDREAADRRARGNETRPVADHDCQKWTTASEARASLTIKRVEIDGGHPP
jgi:hypothetical protein